MGLASMVYKFFDKKTSATRANKFAGEAVKDENMTSKELAEDLHKSINRKLKKKKNMLTFYRQYWGADLANMQLICKFDKGIRFLLCIIDIFTKYAWFVLLKRYYNY